MRRGVGKVWYHKLENQPEKDVQFIPCPLDSMNSRERAAFSTTLFGVTIPLPTPQGRWDRQFSPGLVRDRSRAEIRGPQSWRDRQPSGQEAHSAALFRKEYQVCNEARKTSCLAPYSIFRSDCHLPAMIRLTGGYARSAAYYMLFIAAMHPTISKT